MLNLAVQRLTRNDRQRIALEVDGRMSVEGEFVDTVTGIPGSRTEIVGLRAPGGGTWIELSSFVSPDYQPGPPARIAHHDGQ